MLLNLAPQVCCKKLFCGLNRVNLQKHMTLQNGAQGRWTQRMFKLYKHLAKPQLLADERQEWVKYQLLIKKKV